LPWGVTWNGDDALVTDLSNHAIRHIKVSTKEVTTIAGPAACNRVKCAASGTADGVGTAARFYLVSGIAVNNGAAFVADQKNNRIRRLDTVA
jgi:hypothetical protein